MEAPTRNELEGNAPATNKIRRSRRFTHMVGISKRERTNILN